jgi:hypothetical protein
MRSTATLFATLALVPSLLAAPQRMDCAGAACPELRVEGDRYDTLPGGQPSPFRGFADPSIRQDPDGRRLWMAYSWPHVMRPDGRRRASRSRGTAAVEAHLASSDDGGTRWRFRGVLWAAAAATAPGGEPGHTSYEVANLLPHQTRSGVVWYAARAAYFLPDGGGFAGRSPQSFRIEVLRAPSLAALTNAVPARLGAAAAGGAWTVDVNLATLSPEVRHCSIWNEPALHMREGELYLALSCMAFRGRTPDMTRNDLVVFATRPDGEPRRWTWRYAGRLATAADAKALGAERLTQIELARGRDGTLLAIVTPDRWDQRRGDFVHEGCRVLEVESLRSPALARDASGRLRVRAEIVASDAGAHDTAACGYDAASSTGIVIGRRSKENVGLGGASGRGAEMSVTLHRTGVRP